MNEWDDRADYYRASRNHAEGADLDRLIEWCEPGAGVTALDVATGGGHVARRLRELGCEVTTCDASAGMEPDVVCPAEALPFAARTFDVVACRVALHHFNAPAAAMAEMGRVGRRFVVLEDTLYAGEAVQKAEKLRDVTHVRHYTREQLVAMLEAGGLTVVAAATFEKRHEMEDWLSGTGCRGSVAARVRRLLAPVASPDGTSWNDTKLVVKARIV